ncbi:MAG: hypothetical protein AAGF92_06070 [Myxococcota bacterium]
MRRAIGVVALVSLLATTASAGPENSPIGGKRLQNDQVHSVGVGYPSVYYAWWNRGRRNLDWAIQGDLVYGDWAAAYSRGRFIRVGLGVSAPLQWHLATKNRARVTNDVAFRFTPGILLSRSAFNTFTFGIKTEASAPVSIDVHERVSVVTGGAIPLAVYITGQDRTFAVIPLLIRMGVEIKANERVSPFFLFELGPGIAAGQGSADVSFAWRLWFGTSFWGVRK